MLTGRDGGRWLPEAWHLSRTFRLGDQENLMLADNRTQAYAEASLRRGRKLARLNCGDPGVGAPAPLAVRLGRRLAWRWRR